MKNSKALFLDRDGVVCESIPHGEYITKPEECVVAEGIGGLMREARSRGYLVVVVTNQPQIAYGFATEEDVAAVHAKINEGLPDLIDSVYYCPHQSSDNCECRKPKTGMILAAAEEFGIDLGASLMVGDTDKDVNAGKAAGCRTVFLKNKHHAHDLAKCDPDHVVDDPRDIIPLL